MDDDGVGTREASTSPRVANGLMAAGLTVMAVSLVVPFASNEGGCLDHCADARSYFVWHPLHNIGAPFLAVGVVAAVVGRRSTERRRLVTIALGSLCGWIGVVLLYSLAPAVIEEAYLYGGPELDVSGARWIVLVGWFLTWLGSVARR